MKKILLIFLCFPFFGYAQKTYIPDDAFEQRLINLDLDDVFDDSVYTSAIDTVLTLYISNNGVADLTGIEDFIQLSNLFCSGNQIIDLDLSNNANLFELNCNDNLLVSLDVRNGNNSGLWYFTAVNNPQLYCIAVNDIAYANYIWLKDSDCVFSTNCSITSWDCDGQGACVDPGTGLGQYNTLSNCELDCIFTPIEDYQSKRKLIKVLDVFGRSVTAKPNMPLMYIYDDGSVEKRIMLD